MATKLKQASIAIRQKAARDNSPRWDGADEWDSAKFTRHYYSAMEWYRLEKTNKDLKPKVIDWMGANGYDKEDIQAFKRTKDNRCSLTVGSIAACLLRGMPEVHEGFNGGKDTAQWLRNQIHEILNQGANDVDESEDAVKPAIKQVVAVPTIQDRMREAAGAMSEEIDQAIDSFITDPDAFDPKAFKLINLLRGKGAKAAHARFIKGYFQRGYDELAELAGGSADDQLREAYRHLPRKNVRKLIDFYESVLSACDQIAAEQKVLKKPRAKKVKPAEDLVKKLKFRAVDDKLGIVSVPPANLIGAQSAVVYNTKTRKVGIYIAKSSAGLSVKGTSIAEFTDKSFQKTLRKPAEQLKEFKEQNTAKRIETWFSKIKSAEIVLNGRMNEDVVILKVFK